MSLAPRAPSLAMTRASRTPGPEVIVTGAYQGHRKVSRTTSSVCRIKFISMTYFADVRICRHQWDLRTRIEMKEGKDLACQAGKGRRTSVSLPVLRQDGLIFYYLHYFAQLESPSHHGKPRTISSSAHCGGKCLILWNSFTKLSSPISVL